MKYNVHLLAINFLLPFSLSAMDQPKNIPACPTITIGEYANTLVMGDSLDGWGELTGNTHSWLQNTANKNRVSNTQNQLLDDLPFFLETLAPAVEGGSLRCDYSLPVEDEDLSRGSSKFSIFKKTTIEELAVAKEIAPEIESNKKFRKDEWRKNLVKQKTSNLVDSKLLNGYKLPTFVGFLEPSSSFYTMRALFEEKTNPNSCYFEINGKAKKCVIISSGRAPLIGIPRNPVVAEASEITEGRMADIYVNDGDVTLTLSSFGIGGSLFDINGSMTIKSDKIKFLNTICQLSGDLKFISANENCYIHKITLRPADSTNPMLIWADLDFSDAENPKVIIEGFNVNMMQIKYRKTNDKK